MAENILESYLVQLGATEDTASFVKFHNTLKTAARAVEGFTTGAVADFVKLELGIVSTFSAFGVGLISLADKTAMADQQFGLMGARMLMTKNSFRSMQTALDTLGVTMTDVMSDTTGELQKEFQDLYARNIELGKQLGGTFDQSMVGIRKTRIEFKQFGTELEFLSMKVIDQLFQKLGFGSGDITAKLREFNDWFTTQLPDMADKVTTYLVPAWKDMEIVLGGVKKNAEFAGVAFTNMIATVSGDQALSTTTLNFDKLGRAIIKAADAAVRFNNAIGLYFNIANHAVGAGAGVLGGLWEGLVKGDAAGESRVKGAGAAEWHALTQDLKTFANPALGYGNPDFADIIRQSDAENDPNRFVSPRNKDLEDANTLAPTEMASAMAKLAQRVSASTGIPANLIYSQWAFETAGFTSSVFRNNLNAGGMRIPGSTAYQTYGSLDQFADSYTRTIKSGRYTSQGILGAKTDQDFSMALKKGGYYEATQPAYAAGMHRWEGTYPGGDVNIAKIEINMPAHASDERMSKIIHEAMTTHINKTTRNVTAQTAAGAHY
jgi:hypothetical protein